MLPTGHQLAQTEAMRGRYPGSSNVMYSFGPGPLTPAVKMIMIANVIVFLLTYFARDQVIALFGLTPSAVLTGLAIWQPLTYMFVHASVSHVFFNMLTLWFIGVELERLWGTKYFTRYYFVCGLGAGLTQILLSAPFPEQFYRIPTVGASGAIYGLLLAFALYYPTRPFLVFFVFPLQARYFVMILGGMSLLFSLEGGSGVAHTAHLGGLVTGYLYLKGLNGKRLNIISEIQYRFLKWRINRMRKKFDVYSGGRRDDWDRRVH